MEIKSARKLKSDSAEIYEIPEELITEILIRTQVESLVKFRCVSKSWCALISSKSFIGSQLDFSKKKTNNVRIIMQSNELDTPVLVFKQYYLNALLNRSDDTAPEFYYPLGKESIDFQFIGSCNGLCCALIGTGTPSIRVRGESRSCNSSVIRRLFVWNPSTRMSRELFLFYTDGVLNHFDGFCYGFGSYGDDYKVVAIHPTQIDPARKVVELYSLKLNSWKRAIKWLPEYLGKGDTPGKFANGKLYWIRNLEKGLFYFDLGTELFGMIEPPPPPPSSSLTDSPQNSWSTFRLDLEVFQERVCMLSYIYTRSLDVWVLRDESSWDKMISILPHQSILGIPLWLPEEGEMLLKYNRLHIPDIRVYDLKRNSARRTKVVVLNWILITYVHMTSLVSPWLDDCEPNQRR